MGPQIEPPARGQAREASGGKFVHSYTKNGVTVIKSCLGSQRQEQALGYLQCCAVLMTGRRFMHPHLLEAASETANASELGRKLLYATPSGWYRFAVLNSASWKEVSGETTCNVSSSSQPLVEVLSIWHCARRT